MGYRAARNPHRSLRARNAQIISRRLDGALIKQICLEFDISPWTAQSVLRRAKLTRRKQPPAPVISNPEDRLRARTPCPITALWRRFVLLPAPHVGDAP